MAEQTEKRLPKAVRQSREEAAQATKIPASAEGLLEKAGPAIHNSEDFPQLILNPPAGFAEQLDDILDELDSDACRTFENDLAFDLERLDVAIALRTRRLTLGREEEIAAVDGQRFDWGGYFDEMAERCGLAEAGLPVSEMKARFLRYRGAESVVDELAELLAEHFGIADTDYPSARRSSRRRCYAELGEAAARVESKIVSEALANFRYRAERDKGSIGASSEGGNERGSWNPARQFADRLWDVLLHGSERPQLIEQAIEVAATKVDRERVSSLISNSRDFSLLSFVQPNPYPHTALVERLVAGERLPTIIGEQMAAYIEARPELSDPASKQEPLVIEVRQGDRLLKTIELEGSPSDQLLADIEDIVTTVVESADSDIEL